MIARIGTSPKGMILVITSSGKRMFRRMVRSIQRSAWKGNSRKYTWPRSATVAKNAPKDSSFGGCTTAPELGRLRSVYASRGSEPHPVVGGHLLGAESQWCNRL